MIIYGVKKADGGCAIMRLFPIAAIDGDGDRWKRTILVGDATATFTFGDLSQVVDLNALPQSWSLIYQTPEEHVATWPADAQAMLASPLEYVEITEADVPTDRTFRDALEVGGAGVFVSIAKAKNIAHTLRRSARENVFAPLRVITSKAAQGIPLAPGEDAVAAMAAMTDYKTTVDDVAQTAIDAAQDEAGLFAAIAGIALL